MTVDNLTDEDRARGGRNNYRHVCRECGGAMLGDTCDFCERCDDEGIGNYRYQRGGRDD